MSPDSSPIPVSIVRCPDYDPDKVQAALSRCLHLLGGIGAFVSKGDRVLLKPNLLSPSPPGSAVCTHPEIVRAVAKEVMEAGGRVYLGDSPAVGSVSMVLRKSGIMDVVRDLGIEISAFRTPVRVPVPEGGVYRSLLLAREALGFDLIINLPRFKTHGMMTLTLAVKNMFGIVVGVVKPGWHLRTVEPGPFADMLLDIWRAQPPGLNILDGITAMEGNGPGSGGDPFPLGLLMASTSALALDHAAGEIAGVPAQRHPVLKRARDRSIAGAEPGSLRIIGAGIEEVRRPFVLPVKASNVDYRLPAWVKGPLKKSINTFPVLNKDRCTSCGQCVSICLVGAIVLHGEGRGGGVVDKMRCIGCCCCQETCPERAIDMIPGRLRKVLGRMGLA